MSLLDSVNNVLISFNNFARDSVERFDHGLLAILTWVLSKITQYLILAYIKSIIFFLGLAWAVAKSVITDIGIIPAVNTALASIAPQSAAILQLFGFTDALNIILTALTARLIFRFLPV